MFRVFFAWWGRQLLEVLPASWRRRPQTGETGDAVLLTLSEPSAGQRPSLDALRRRGRRDVPLGRFALDEKGLQSLRAAIGTARRGVIRLLLPPRLLLEQQVTLPLAAERGLETALRWEMDRLTPFPADAVFWSSQVEQRDRQRGRLQLRLRLVPKAAVASALEALAAAGLQPAWLASAAEPARAIPLTGPRAAKRGARGLVTLGVVLACLFVASIAIPFIKQELEFRRLNERIAALGPEVNVADGLRRRLSERAASADVVGAEAARVGDALRILATITELLPDNTYLYDLTLRDRMLTISGQSGAAAGLIPTMAANPAIRDPVFAAPVTRNEMTGAETFSIRAEMRP